MDVKDIRPIRDVIHDISSAELIFVSLFLLPILFGSWLVILNALNLLPLWKIIVSVILLILYIIGVIVMKWWEPPEEKLKRAVRHVKNRLEQRKGNRASFMAIREEVDKNYNDDFLRKLIEKNPGTFRTVKVKRNGKSMPGITLGEEELDNS